MAVIQAMVETAETVEMEETGETMEAMILEMVEAMRTTISPTFDEIFIVAFQARSISRIATKQPKLEII
jgi:hypothetical protein